MVAGGVAGWDGSSVETFDSLPAEGVRLQLTERLPQRYVFVDDGGSAHVILPIVSGTEVGVGNTWKAVSELQRFFGAAHDSARVRDSAAHQLKGYGESLDFDLWLLARLALSSHSEYRGKALRRCQVRLYEQAVEAAAAEQEVQEALRGFQPTFPESLSAVIAGSPNLLSMRLSPSSPTQPLGLQSPSFSLFQAPPGDRGVAAFRDALLRLMESVPPWRAQAARAAAAADASPTANATATASPVEASVFHSATDPELTSVLAQGFLALLNLHRCAYESDPRNLGSSMDLDASCAADSIHDALLTIQKSPEDALLSWAAGPPLYAPLPAGHEAALKRQFCALAAAAATTPRPDEFLVLFDDVDGQGFAHEGCICVHFGDFLALPAEVESPRLHLRGQGSEGAAPARTAAAAFTDIRKKMTAAGAWPPPRRTESPAKAWLDVGAEALRSIILDADAHRAAELLLATATSPTCPVPKPLYELIGSAGCNALRASRSDWESVKGLLIDRIAGQEALDNFSRCEDAAHAWVRVTSSMARSIYTEAACTVAADEFANVDKELRPDKLHKALGILGINVEQASIRQSCTHDGHTVAVVTAEKQVLLGIHERRKLSLHLGPVEMRLIEDEMNRRFPAGSAERFSLRGLDNDCLRTIAHPHLFERQVQAPEKIFHVLALLDLVIPGWEESGPGGYIVTVDEPATINELEGVIALSRQHKR